MNKYNLSEKRTEEELKSTCDHIDIGRKSIWLNLTLGCEDKKQNPKETENPKETFYYRERGTSSIRHVQENKAIINSNNVTVFYFVLLLFRVLFAFILFLFVCFSF